MLHDKVRLFNTLQWASFIRTLQRINFMVRLLQRISPIYDQNLQEAIDYHRLVALIIAIKWRTHQIIVEQWTTDYGARKGRANRLSLLNPLGSKVQRSTSLQTKVS